MAGKCIICDGRIDRRRTGTFVVLTDRRIACNSCWANFKLLRSTIEKNERRVEKFERKVRRVRGKLESSDFLKEYRTRRAELTEVKVDRALDVISSTKRVFDPVVARMDSHGRDERYRKAN